MSLLISVLQMQPVAGDVDGNLAKIEKAARVAREMDADLLVVPELAVTGYSLAGGFAAIAEPRDGPSIQRMQACADTFGLAIAVGFAERDGANIYNSSVLVRPSGAPEFYRKCHLYGAMEQAAFSVSDTAPHVFSLGGIIVGMLICYDVEFPEMVRGLALAGADLVIVPTALPAGKSAKHVSELVVPTRAMENQLFIAYADLCGREGDFAYEGRSVIAAPDGEALARAGQDETMLFATIDTSAYAACRKENPYLTDRRPGIYGLFGR